MPEFEQIQLICFSTYFIEIICLQPNPVKFRQILWH